MMHTLKLDDWVILDKIHDRLCPQIRTQTDMVCHTDCVFSCVKDDVDMMAEVLRTLEVVNEQTK